MMASGLDEGPEVSVAVLLDELPGMSVAVPLKDEPGLSGSSEAGASSMLVGGVLGRVSKSTLPGTGAGVSSLLVCQGVLGLLEDIVVVSSCSSSNSGWVSLDTEFSKCTGETDALLPITAFMLLKNGKLAGTSSSSDSLPSVLFISLSVIALYFFLRAFILAQQLRHSTVSVFHQSVDDFTKDVVVSFGFLELILDFVLAPRGNQEPRLRR